MPRTHATLLAALALTVPAGAAAAPARAAVGQLFVLSDACMACHNGLITARGEDISIGTDWQSSMMAHSARDPYWQAAVRREVIDHPSARAAIEDECSICHMPMARFTAHAAGGEGGIFAHLSATFAATPLDRLAVAGVSCATCHQITSTNLGDRSSFVGRFDIDAVAPTGQRRIFGPFEVDAGRTTVMRSASNFVPAQADHVQSSELCATCHTLYTHTFDEQGEVIGGLPEQVPYLEWRHSAYRSVRGCQSCHMPVVEGETAISAVLGQPRSGVSRHVFRGGNFFMPRVLNRYADELAPQAQPQELETTARRTAQHLQQSSATIAVERVRAADGRFALEVEVANLAGHKLPTAYPSRRVWIHVEVEDRNGRSLFSSGALVPDGSIAGNDNDDDPARFEPHHAEISDPGEVQIYEAIMADPDGRVTTGLLTAVRFVKDNRLLPDGFDKATADPDVAVQGRAAGDEDFSGGRDRVRYEIALDGAEGPYRVLAELVYQPIAFRWARNLAAYEADEPDRFVRIYDEMSELTGIVLASDQLVVP